MPIESIQVYKSSASWFKYKAFNLAYWQHYAGADKPTVLFIHGFPSASWDWHNQWQALKNEYNLLTLDLLGFGLSDKPSPYRYTLVEQAQIIVKWINSLKISTCHILAHDYGDSVAQELLYLSEAEHIGFKIESITFLNGGLFSEAHNPCLNKRF